jgi:uncharacterized protein (DUF2336 family)
MIVRRFLAWSRMVPPGQRAEGVSALALGYLYSQMAPEVRREAEAALTAVLEDPSPLVRRALAEAFASAVDAPHHCVLALAHDQPDIAALVLERSPVLSDQDLIDCAAAGAGAAQVAIARRPKVSSLLSAALAEMACVEALRALAENGGAEVPEFGLRRMLERFGADAGLREAMLGRAELPICVRLDLVCAGASALTAFVRDCGWLTSDRAERLRRDASERAIMDIALAEAPDDSRDGALEMAQHLRAAGRLTPALMLRALLSGDRGLFGAALAELAGQPLARVAGFVRFHQGSGFQALFDRARMPPNLLPVFQAALWAQDEAGEHASADSARLSRTLIAHVLRACEDLEDPDLAQVMALLRRFDAEAAQDEARALTKRICEGQNGFVALPNPAPRPLLLAVSAAS